MIVSSSRLKTEAHTDGMRLRNKNPGCTLYEVHVTPEGEPLRRRPSLDLDLRKNRQFVRRAGISRLHMPGSLLASTDDEEVAEAICRYWNQGKQRVALHGEAWIWEETPE